MTLCMASRRSRKSGRRKEIERQLTDEFVNFCELNRDKLAGMKDNSTRMNFIWEKLRHIPQYLVLRAVRLYLKGV